MLKAEIVKHRLHFSFPAGTSRGVLQQKDTWYLCVTDDERPGIEGVGECSPLFGLSPEDPTTYEEKLREVAKRIEDFDHYLRVGLLPYPSIRFGLEMALIDFHTGGNNKLFDTSFTRGEEGLLTNGLVWMKDPDKMLDDALQKAKAGFTCMKFKIGAFDWKDEFQMLKSFREQVGQDIIMRVDANGAYDHDQAMQVCADLATLKVHSIEQPIRAGQREAMLQLCQRAATPIALDEELIGLKTGAEKLGLLDETKPQFIILKPSLVGGFFSTREWINIAAAENVGWWITSALESNVGLNAIAQFTSTFQNPLHQGLGTGSIYENNVGSPLAMKGEKLFMGESSWQSVHTLS